MSQEPTSADQGVEDFDDGQLQPIEADPASGASFEDTLGKSLLEAMGVPDFGDEPEQPEAQPSDEAEEAESPIAASTVASDTPLSADEQMQRWVEQVAGNPKSINQIPAKHHPAIMQAAFERERANQQRELDQATERGRQQERDAGAVRQRHEDDLILVAQIDARKNNPDVNPEDALTGLEWYAKLRDSTHPNDLALLQRYDATREAIRNPQAAQQQQNAQALNLAAFQAAAAPLRKQLDAHPEAKAKLQANLAANPNLYGLTAEGMEQFSADVAEAIADARVAARTAKEAPARAQLEQRAANTTGRRSLPRPDVSSGSKFEPGLGNSVAELLAQGWREEAAAQG